MDLVNELNRQFPKGTRMIHKYSGNVYYFYKASLHTETGEAMMNYEDSKGNFFSRPSVHFFSKEITTDGFKDRFEIHDYVGADQKIVAKWVQDLLSVIGLPFKI